MSISRPETPAPVDVTVCDACLQAVWDEAPGLLDTAELQAEAAIEYGRDIGDHRCEKWDDNEIKCACACTRRGLPL